MKYSCLIIILFIFGCSAQKNLTDNSNQLHPEINSDNYYDYESIPSSLMPMVKMNWIREDEIVEILFEEFEKLGYKLKRTNLFKLSEDEFIIVNGFYEKEKFGFIVESGHSVPIRKSDRDKNKSFQHTMYHSGGRPKFVQTKAIPENIFIFRENWYWFQECMGCAYQPAVTKKIAKKILLEDLNKYLTNFNNK